MVNRRPPKLPHFNRNCSLCSLSTGQAVTSRQHGSLTNIKLIVISDHPGVYEEKTNRLMETNEPRKPTKTTKLIPWRNAGGYLRHTLTTLFDLDTDREVWFTNAVRCNPNQHTIKDEHRKICTQNWLKQELAVLDYYIDKIPILIAGRQAYKAIKILDPELYDKLGNNLNKQRRSTHWHLGSHPLVFTFNPAAVCKTTMRIETNIGLTREKLYTIHQIRELPPLPGSPEWNYHKDLECLREFIYHAKP